MAEEGPGNYKYGNSSCAWNTWNQYQTCWRILLDGSVRTGERREIGDDGTVY